MNYFEMAILLINYNFLIKKHGVKNLHLYNIMSFLLNLNIGVCGLYVYLIGYTWWLPMLVFTHFLVLIVAHYSALEFFYAAFATAVYFFIRKQMGEYGLIQIYLLLMLIPYLLFYAAFGRQKH